MRQRAFRVVSQIMSVPIEEIDETSSPSSLANWDSLMHMNLVLALEEEFGVQFTDDDIVNMTTVKLILETLEKHK